MTNLTNTNTTKPFLTRSELAARWGCSVSTIKRREAGGKLVPTRFGPRLLRFSMADILAFERRPAIEPPTGESIPNTEQQTPCNEHRP